MDFQNSFLPVYIKYDFISENHQPTLSHDWIECRLNVKSSPNSYKNIQMNVYPKFYDELFPYFTLDIEYEILRYGPMKSRSKTNVYGMLWPCNEKMCRIFISFDDKTIHHNFSKYFRKLLKSLKSFNNCESEYKGLTENIKSSVCNEAKQMTSNENESSSSVQVMRVSDASGQFEEVLLRPHNEQNRRLARPLAVISGLFKSNRESSNMNQEENDKISPNFPSYDKKNDQHKLKRKSWNIFKLKRKNHRDERISSFQHFQEPLNIDGRLSLPVDNDLEWYDLNKAEMSLLEARMSIVLNQFNKCNQTSDDSESESDCFYRCNIGRPSTISSNILRSHNLLVSCQSTDNASNINLFDANIDDESNNNNSESNVDHLEPNKCESELKLSFTSTDSNGYAVVPMVQSIQSKKCIESAILIDGKTKIPRGFHSDESSHFSSESDEGSQQKSIVFTNSLPTTDFSDAYSSDKSNECFPATSLTARKIMQKTLKKRSFRIKSRKLLGMLNVKSSPSPPLSPSQSQTQMVTNVMPTPQNKSPLACMKKVYKKGTPFKILRSTKQAHEKIIMKPLQSLHI